jgi:hypothetical protein
MAITEADNEIRPSCRYRHGNLELVEADKGVWALMLLKSKGQGDSQTWAPTNIGYGVNLYVCPECGYLELFDDEVSNG